MFNAVATQPTTMLQRVRRRARHWAGRVQDKWTTRRFDYAHWLADHIARRRERLCLHAKRGQFSLLTGVYEKTPADLFAETAAAVFAQTSNEFEWVILAHGPIPEPVRRVLKKVVEDPRVRLIELDENRGIIGGMRVCLEAATGRYVIPLDADDLLFPDALQTCAQVIADEGEPAFLYSDEDHLVDGRPQSPFARPDWDPVLNAASSYIWHLCAFDRETALRLGVYTDAGSNYCHDWDTVFRFARAGLTPHHLPELLYHWRTHAGSHTNNRRPHPGSQQSQRHVLHEHIAAQPRPELYDVQPFPLDRGGAEWAIVRKPIDPPDIELLVDAESIGTCDEVAEIVHRRRVVEPQVAAILNAAAMSSADIVGIVTDRRQPRGAGWLWEAVKLFELHPDAALVAGRTVDRAGLIAGGGEIRDSAGQYTCPELFRDETAAGPYALWLKPQSVDAVDPHFFLARTAFLREAARHFVAGDFAQWGRRLGEFAAQRGERVATSPLVAAYRRQS